MPAALANSVAVEPTYEQHLHRLLRTAYQERAEQFPTPSEFADIAMKVLTDERENAHQWGVGCTGCAHYLDRTQLQHIIGERAGVELFRQAVHEGIKEAERQWTSSELKFEHLTKVIAGFLRQYHSGGAGSTFTTPPSP